MARFSGARLAVVSGSRLDLDKLLVYFSRMSSLTEIDGPGERMRVGADELTFRVTAGETGGALLAAEVRMPPGGGPPPLHRHAAEEVYRVDRGELTIHLEDADGDVERIPAGPGDVVHIPGGRAHTVRNESDAEARAYVVFSPASEIEQFFRAAAELSARGAPDIEEVLALARRHSVEMAG